MSDEQGVRRRSTTQRRQAAAPPLQRSVSDEIQQSGVRCPISLDIMVDPVQTADGQVYDRRGIADWFAQGHVTSPNTNLPLSNTSLDPYGAHALITRNVLRELIADNPDRLANIDLVPLPPQPSPLRQTMERTGRAAGCVAARGVAAGCAAGRAAGGVCRACLVGTAVRARDSCIGALTCGSLAGALAIREGIVDQLQSACLIGCACGAVAGATLRAERVIAIASAIALSYLGQDGGKKMRKTRRRRRARKRCRTRRQRKAKNRRITRRRRKAKRRKTSKRK